MRNPKSAHSARSMFRLVARASGILFGLQAGLQFGLFLVISLAAHESRREFDWSADFQHWFTTGDGAKAAVACAVGTFAGLLWRSRSDSRLVALLVAVLLSSIFLTILLTPEVVTGGAPLSQALTTTASLWIVVIICGATSEAMRPEERQKDELSADPDE